MNKWLKRVATTILSTSLLMGLTACGSSENEKSDGKGPVEILNVSYDPTRELYEEFNKTFSEYWLKTQGQEVEVKQSHGGSGKQARSVIDGLKADVVTLALGYDIDSIQKNGLITEGWQKRNPNNSAPYTSTIVFLVRKGNPKGIKDWGDLVAGDTQVITPNPKTSGGARWNYLAALGYAQKAFNNDSAQVGAYMQNLFAHVPVLDSGARAATTTFVEREIGDVLLSWENEALLAKKQYGDKFEIVYPSISILAEPPVSVVDKVVDDRGTRKVAEGYLQYLYSDEGQKLVAKHFFRPTSISVLEANKEQFPQIELLQIGKDFESWDKMQEIHFADGGVFDQIVEANQ
jgi:sulfate/thiosulfate transport system substrate-binding protein